MAYPSGHVAFRISLPKANPASPQRRRYAAHRGRSPDVHDRSAEAADLQTRWQRVAGLILEEADVAAVSRQLELALFMDAKLDVAKMPA